VVDNDWYEQWKKSLLWKDSFQKAIIDKGFDWVIVKVYNDPDFNLAWDQLVIYKPLWEKDLIQQAKKYESADDFISSELEIEVSIDDLIPTEWHTYDNTIKKHWWPRKEFAKKPPYVLLKKNGKFNIVDWNHRYFLAKEEGERIMKVKLENFFPVSNKEKTHLNILKEIWKKANNDWNKSEKDDELEKLYKDKEEKANLYNEALKNNSSKEEILKRQREYQKVRDKLSEYKRKTTAKKITKEEIERNKKNEELCQKIKSMYKEKKWKEIKVVATIKWQWWRNDWFWVKTKNEKVFLWNYTDLTSWNFEEIIDYLLEII